uniref:G-protein coupled receptors family 3 profile domain-containing protein n=1 Tax=Eptatretus burgeri TaxID=7764 RepID=A0A8C4RE10_EPTBU
MSRKCCSNPFFIIQSASNESKYFTFNNIPGERKTEGCCSENYTHLKSYAMKQLKSNSYFMTNFQSQSNTTRTIYLNNKETLKPIFMEFWEDLFNCTWNLLSKSGRACTGRESLEDVKTPFTDVSQLRYSYNAYLAVYVVAHAFHDMQSCIPGKGPFNSTCKSIFTYKPWQVKYAANRVISLFHILFNGDPPGLYDLISWNFDRGSVMDFKVVGSYNSSAPPGEKLHVDEQHIRWNGGTSQVPRSVCSDPCAPGTRKMGRQGESICCFDCIPCIAGEFSNVTDSQGCYRCPHGFWSNELHNSCLQMPEEFLAFSDALGIVLLLFAMIGGLMVIGFMLLIITQRNLSIMSGMNHTINVIQLLVLAVCVSLSIACTLYNVIELAVINKGGLKFQSEFQEPKLITYNMMFCFIVSLAFVPAYSSTQGKFATAIEICAVVAISYSFLGCAFFPKCYVILCKMQKV